MWQRVTMLLCLYGCMKEIKPSTHFLTQYLEGPWINLTHSQVTNEVYPIWTYSYLCLLFFIPLLTDYVRYKPIILLESLAYVVTWVLLLWTNTLLGMQFTQFTYGVGTSAEVAYYSYIYTKVPSDQYRKVTSFTRAAILAGKLCSAIAAQVLISTNIMTYSSLNYVSLASVSISFLLSILLPSVKQSSYFHTYEESSEDRDEPCANNRKPKNSPNNSLKAELQDDYTILPMNDLSANLDQVQPIEPNDLQGNLREDLGEYSKVSTSLTISAKPNTTRYKSQSCGQVFKKLYSDFKSNYSNSQLLKWSIWWALGSSGCYQVTNYVQPLWEDIHPAKENEIYNGAVDAIKTILGTVATLLLAYVKVNWSHHGESVFFMISVLDAGLLYTMSKTEDIWIAYSCYIAFRVSYHILITIASFQVAHDLQHGCYALVFGCNTLLALILQTLITAIVVDKSGLNLGPRSQFLVYASYYCLSAVLFAVIAVHRVITACLHSKKCAKEDH